MKRLVINIILSVVFILSAWMLARPFMAGKALKEAAKLNAGFRWDDADKKIGLAARLDPLSAESNAAIGRLYAARASIVKDKAPVLLKAESKYKRAYQLNPHDTANLMEMATLEKELFLAEPDLYKDRINNAVGYFKEAFGKDPNNYIINYEIGRNYVELWKYSDDENKKFAFERFKSCLKLAPWYSEGIYYVLWRRFGDFNILLAVTPENPVAYENLYDFIVKNGLWKYRKEVLGKIGGSKKRTATGTAWFGKSRKGSNVYKNGNMYWPGTVNRIIGVSEGRILIKIKAKGDEAYGVWPYMVVELNGQEIGEASVNSEQWKEYEFKADTDGSIKTLSVTFVNDACDEKKGIDRNLYVGEVEVQKYE